MFKIAEKLLPQPAGMKIDFLHPAGAPALTPAGSVSWLVFSNPVSLFIGGVAAVLLEMAEPSVRTGVWEHSSFRRDPLTRLQRTGYAAMVTVYAPREQAEQLIARVVRMHDKVNGSTPDGTPYQANDPRLLNWVQATASFGFCQAFHQYARPLSQAQRDAFFSQSHLPASLYGATEAPVSEQQWLDLLQATAPQLEDSAIIEEFLSIMEGSAILPGLPFLARPLQKLLVAAAVEITPAPVRSYPALQKRRLSWAGKTIAKGLARLAQALPLPDMPSAQAQQRMRHIVS